MIGFVLIVMDLDGKTVLVIGAGRTGLAVTRFLIARGARVRLADRRNESAADLLEKRLSFGVGEVDWRLGEDGETLLEGIDLVVPSPGVSRNAPLLRVAQGLGLGVLAEIELAWRALSCPLVAITGTNGKSTTTELVGDMLRRAGRRVFVGGNLGTPLVDATAERFDLVVAEISSFQLEWIERFRPKIGAFLNLTEDHLDRYTSLDDYGEAKAGLFRNQDASDWAVLSRDDPWVWKLRERVRSRVVSFGRTAPVGSGAFPGAQTIVVRLPDVTERRFDVSRARLVGFHNLENMMAAATMALLAGASESAVQAAFDEFVGLAHRLELVCVKNGVRYVDDSKGTNVGAVVKSLESIDPPVILLAGGVDKGGSYEPLRFLVRERVKRLVAYGEAREEIARVLGGETETVVAGSFEEAVRLAAGAACAGDTVLLSPACASFDMFRDYADRGERFRRIVETL